MEKRFLLFIVLSMAVMTGYQLLNQWMAGGQPAQVADVEQPADGAPEAGDGANGEGAQEAPAADGQAADEAAEQSEDESPAAEQNGNEGEAAAEQANGADDQQPAVEAADDETQPRWVTLGSADPRSPYKLLMTFSSRAAALEQLEIVERTDEGRYRFRHLDDSSGYLGYLAPTSQAEGGGCRINAVPAGTPAARATAAKEGHDAGLAVGDIIVQIDDRPIPDRRSFEAAMAAKKPGESVTIEVRRADVSEPLEFTAKLEERPFVLIGPEAIDPEGPQSELSFRMSLGAALTRSTAGLSADPGLATRHWEVSDQGEDFVEFRYRVPADAQGKLASSADLEFLKRYRLVPVQPDSKSIINQLGYHLLMELEVRNASDKPRKLAYRLQGPNSLTTEGWWYTTKIHPSFFGSAGARDVVWNAAGTGHQIRSAREIYNQITGESPEKPLFSTATPEDDRQLNYIGVDAQYFSVIMMPGDIGKTMLFDQVTPLAVGHSEDLEKRLLRLTNSSFELTSTIRTLEAGESFVERYTVFAGPKDSEVLTEYGLNQVLYYGWFPWVARPLSKLLHGFYFIVRNYGLAIIMLTVLVRACMFPLSRKAAKNSAMMQQLAPEMKKLSERYKNDMEKRVKAQRELYAKYNFNPFSGCLLVFLQLPIFIGLYRCLSVDIELRQASLIPGIEWASNLAGPDMFWRWPLPEFLGGKTGFLGPYLNILPVITVALFLVQQKLFTPPAVDEQQKLQQQMMKYMMVVIGVMFFKVPAGLCIYFIASSIWGIAERMLLPKTIPPANQNNVAAASSSQKGGDPPPRRKQRRR